MKTQMHQWGDHYDSNGFSDGQNDKSDFHAKHLAFNLVFHNAMKMNKPAL